MFKDTILKRTHALPFSFFSRWQTLYCKEKRQKKFPQYSPSRQIPDFSRHVFSTAHPPATHLLTGVCSEAFRNTHEVYSKHAPKGFGANAIYTWRSPEKSKVRNLPSLETRLKNNL